MLKPGGLGSATIPRLRAGYNCVVFIKDFHNSKHCLSSQHHAQRGHIPFLHSSSPAPTTISKSWICPCYLFHLKCLTQDCTHCSDLTVDIPTACRQLEPLHTTSYKNILIPILHSGTAPLSLHTMHHHQPGEHLHHCRKLFPTSIANKTMPIYVHVGSKFSSIAQSIEKNVTHIWVH